MNTCKYCGVELDVEMNFCPLCGQKSNQTNHIRLEEFTPKVPVDAESGSYGFKKLTQNQKSKVVWELSTIILVSGIIVPFILNLILNKQVTWSKYTITIGLFLFVNLTLISFLQKRLFMLLLGSFIITSLLLLMLDLYSHNLGWGLKLGIPIIFFIYLIVFLLITVIRRSKQKGFNIIAYFLMAIGILGMSIESILDIHLSGILNLQWSVILLVSVLPVSTILLFIHYRLKRATDLKRFFHI